MTRVVIPTWENEYEDATYPFVDAATLQNESGLFIPPNAFIDAVLHPVGAQNRLRLSRVDVARNRSRVFVGDDREEERCWGDIPAVDPPANINLIDQYGRPSGLLVSSAQRLAVFQTWPTGTHRFNRAATEFTAAVCQPLPSAELRGFLLESGEVFTGDILLVGGPGVELRATTSPPEAALGCGTALVAPATAAQRVRVDIVGDPLFRRATCGDAFETPNFLKTVTFFAGCDKITVHPDATGDLKISVGHDLAAATILRIRNVDGELVFEAVGEPHNQA